MNLSALFSPVVSKSKSVFQEAGTLPFNAYKDSVVALNNHVCLVNTYSIENKEQSYLYRASILEDGSISEFTEHRKLPLPILGASVVLSPTKNKLYLIGGAYNGNYLDSVYVADIDTDENVGEFKLIDVLPYKVSYASVLQLHDRVYLIGGCVEVEKTHLDNGYIDIKSTNKILVSVVGENFTLGEFVEDTPLPFGVVDNTVIYESNKVYLVGGIVDDYISDKIYVASTDKGKLTKFKVYGSFPTNISSACAIQLPTTTLFVGGIDEDGEIDHISSISIKSGKIKYIKPVGMLPVELSSAGTFFTLDTFLTERVYLIGGLSARSKDMRKMYVAELKDLMALS